MAYIPKKISNRIIKNTPKFQKILKVAKKRDVNESDTVTIITDILNEIFGYEKYTEITSELAIRGTFCDLAIKIKEEISYLIEVKAIGIELKGQHLKQAIDYGANKGIQWVMLTNGLIWKLYRIRFEKPINYDLVLSFDFEKINLKNEKYIELLFTLSKEALPKNSREEYYEKVQSVNRFVIGNLLLSDDVIVAIRKELRKFAEGAKIESEEIFEVLKKEVLKRDIIEGEDAENAQKKLKKYFKKKMKK